MSRSVTITRTVPVIEASGSVMSYRMTMTATASTEMDKEIFRLNRRPVNPQDPDSDPVDDFEGICSPIEMDALSIDNPGEDQTQYRADSASVLYENQADADEAWEIVKTDTQGLVDSLNANDRLASTETFTAS